MSNDEDIFLKTFNEMIGLLTKIGKSIDIIKDSIETLLPSIDGLGKGLTNINTQISDLNKRIDSISHQIDDSVSAIQSSQIIERKIETKESDKKPPKTAKKAEAQVTGSTESVMPSNAEHPIFIDLVKKINEASSFKEIGELLIESLEQIESTFSFSRVFYEIRRIGNSLVRKGDGDISPNDKMELIEKLIDWENRLNE